ncbi:DUF3299 domain-containing protein [Cupriavidus agavae]|uniref:DUF3299 domain-containing protein n=1 Tax=Cupriavidus agavae TaxID=1001822 RepID=A0A4Q7RZW8_9BURK|nr:DUF3299 domain-containing protein [Cupriavidus agavae]RZT39405.1 hypothetical protein EV147_2600 [Cupriavidus agavae]
MPRRPAPRRLPRSVRVAAFATAGVLALMAAGQAFLGKPAQKARPQPVAAPATSATLAPLPNIETVAWEMLRPKDWDPMKPFQGLDIATLEDDDPRAQRALEEARAYWQDAPMNPALDGRAARMTGYVVSLDGEGEAIREFLLVPYFGACIHTPPPPANQVVHVVASQPSRAFRTMDVVTVSGTMRVKASQTMMGDAGYQLGGAVVETVKQPF